MAYAGVIATEAALNAMAGENVDATGWVADNKDLWIKQAEAFLNLLVRYDVVTNWASLTANYKAIFTEYGSRYCAVAGILYNTAGFTNLIEAEDMVTYHIYRMQRIEELLRDVNVVKDIGVDVGA